MKLLNNIWTKLKDTVSAMSKKARILAISAIALALIIGVAATVALNRVTYVPLYTGLDASEAGRISQLLKDEGIDHKVEGNGDIYVPKEQQSSLRVSLAAQGYPQSGLSYDLITNSSSFGSTDAETRIRLQYQLQENLRTTIRTMDKVEDCIVIVNLPTQSSFVSSSNRTEASAAVMLDLQAGQKLTNAEAKAMAEFILKSVPALTMDNVSIVDSSMNAYDLSSQALQADGTVYSADQQQLAEQMKAVLTSQALRVLEPALGGGNVAVSVNLSLDFDQKTVSSVEFSPPVPDETEGLIRSSEVLRDTLTDGSQIPGAAGTDSNGVAAGEYVYGETGSSASESLSEVYNYELNEVQTQIAKAQGAVTDLSVAVVINSEVENADEVLGQVEGLVANAIGVNAQYITVAALPFVESANMTFSGYLRESENMLEALSKSQLTRTLCICAALLVGLCIVLVFVKKLVRPPAPPEPEYVEMVEPEPEPVPQVDIEEQTRQLLEGIRLKSEATRKVEELMHADPDAAVQIIRFWLADT